MKEAVELIEAVERTGKVYAYAENYCYTPVRWEMRERYRRGDIGELMYAEGEYIHDCSSIWPDITYGERDHWRNRMYSTFYCTHSLGPILKMTGLRPKKVIGLETQNMPFMWKQGSHTPVCGLEMVTLENGAVVKSIHGWMKREPSNTSYILYGQKGVMETGRLEGSKRMNVYIEGAKVGVGEWEHYDPKFFIDAEQQAGTTGHGGSDFYPTHLFIEKILGRPNGDLAIDVYQAVDMGICGILAWRSILNGNIPIDIPNLRDPAQRDAYRNDHACTNPEVAGDQLIPFWSHEHPEIPDSVYDRVKALWDESKDINGDVQDYT
jgi:predicted dehydrogenase